MPEISVIVPVYKAEAYINRCVDSILNQTFEDFELILVDDGSPDKSGAICDAYAEKDSRVRVIHKPNGGVSSARNAGLQAVQGNWITFVDSDDYVSSAYLEHLYEPEYDLAIAGHMEVTPTGHILETVRYHPVCFRELEQAYFQQLLDTEGKNWLFFCWGRLYSRSIIEKNELRFDINYSSGEDTIFMAMYFVLCHSIIIKDAADLYYVIHDRGTLSTTFDIDYLEGLVETESIVAQTMENRFGMPFPRKSEHELCLAYAGYMGDVAADPNFSFDKKYEIFRYLFKNSYFLNAVENSDTYFPKVSGLYRMVLRLKRPLLMLAALEVLLRIRKIK